MPARVTIQNGQFQDAAGNAITGTLTLQLSQDAVVTGTGTVAPVTVSIVVTAGQAVATPIWGNDNLSPSGTVYVARLFDSSGALVWGPENWSLTGSGPIELNTLTPSSSSLSYSTAIIKNPSADQTISANNLLPAAGNTTQALGTSSAAWSAYLRDVTVSKLNNIRVVDGVRYANIQAALSDLPTNGGIVVCPPGYRETITSKITLGSTTSTAILKLSHDVILTCNITNGTDPMFSVHSGSGIVGECIGSLSSRAAGSVISLAATASITNVIQTADNPQGNIVLERFDIDNVNGGVVSGSFIELVNLNDIAIIRDIHGAYFPNKGIHVSATTGGADTVGPITIQDCYFDGANKAAARPLLIESDGAGATNGVLVTGGYWLNPGTSKACIELNGNGGSTGTLQQVEIINVYTQSGSNSGITGIKITDAACITVDTCAFGVTGGATGHTGLSINSSGSNLTHSIVVRNFRLNSGSSNTGLNNTITSKTLLGSSGTIPLYMYQNTGGSQADVGSYIEGTLQTSGLLTASGINFGGTTLNTYTQGTWTPTATGITTTGTVTYSGSYTQVGRLVTFTITVAMAAASTSAANAGASISLPSTAARDSGGVISNNNNNYTGSVQIHLANAFVTAWTTTTGAASSTIYITGSYETS